MSISNSKNRGRVINQDAGFVRERLRKLTASLEGSNFQLLIEFAFARRTYSALRG
jgi:hypothetical protein